MQELFLSLGRLDGRVHCGVEPWQRHAFQSLCDYCATVSTDVRMEEAEVVSYSERKWFPTAPWSVQLRIFTQMTFFALICQCKLHLLVILIKCQTRHVVVEFLVCVFSHMAVKVTNKSRSSVCEADAPFLLGLTSHGALGSTTLRHVNLKSHQGGFSVPEHLSMSRNSNRHIKSSSPFLRRFGQRRHASSPQLCRISPNLSLRKPAEMQGRETRN